MDGDEQYRLEQQRKAKYARDWRERHPGYMKEKAAAWWAANPERRARYAAKKRLQRLKRKRAIDEASQRSDIS